MPIERIQVDYTKLPNCVVDPHALERQKKGREAVVAYEVVEFHLRENHFKLLRRMSFRWNYGGYEEGVPGGNTKRPYGNSGAATDVIDILGLEARRIVDPKCEDEWHYHPDDEAAAIYWHQETLFAMMITFQHAGDLVLPGRYRKKYLNDDRSWEFIEPTIETR